MQLPRLYLAWLTPALFTPGDAELDVRRRVLAGGKNSRLYKRLVYDLQIAQDVIGRPELAGAGSSFLIVATAAARATRVDEIAEGHRRGDREAAAQSPPTARELERAVNQIEASFYARMERVGGFGGKADQLNAYFTTTGNPDYFDEDLARYRALSPSDVPAAVRPCLPTDRRVELTVVPGEKIVGIR